jgi:hypothetical protein
VAQVTRARDTVADDVVDCQIHALFGCSGEVRWIPSVDPVEKATTMSVLCRSHAGSVLRLGDH